MGVAGRRWLVAQPGGLTLTFALHIVVNLFWQILFAPRRYVSTIYATALCPSLSVLVCLCLSQVGVLLKRMNWSRWLLAWELLLTYPTLSYKKLRVPPKIWYFSLELCSRFCIEMHPIKCEQTPRLTSTQLFSLICWNLICYKCLLYFTGATVGRKHPVIWYFDSV